MNKSQKILVTGATGFVGSYLLRYLVHLGYQHIIAIKRSNSPMGMVADVAERVTWVEGDILDVPFLEEVLQNIDQVYHCAAVVSHDPKDASWMAEVNATGTANVVNVALYRSVQKLLHISSIAAIGRVKNISIVNERNKWQRSKLNSNYGISKYQAEQEVWRGIAEGLMAVIINPGVVLGSGFWGRGTGNFFSKMAEKLRFYPIGGSGFVDVRDVAQMSIQLMESDVHNQRVLAIAENHSYQEIFNQIADELAIARPSFQVKPWMGQIAWRAAAVAAAISRGKNSLPRETVELTSKTFIYENQLSKSLLNFDYLPISQTIRETAQQYTTSTQAGKNHACLPLV